MLMETWPALTAGLRRWICRLGQRRRYAIALRELQALDAHFLKDVGLYPGDLFAAARASADGRGFGRFSMVCVARVGVADLQDCLQFARLLHPDDIRQRFGRPVALDDSDTFRRLFGLDESGITTIGARDLCGQILGLATIARTEPATGELALVVRSDLHRRGLGATLLAHAIRDARAAGLGLLVGYFDYDNVAVRRLARRFGFALSGHATASQARLVISG